MARWWRRFLHWWLEILRDGAERLEHAAAAAINATLEDVVRPWLDPLSALLNRRCTGAGPAATAGGRQQALTAEDAAAMLWEDKELCAFALIPSPAELEALVPQEPAAAATAATAKATATAAATANATATTKATATATAVATAAATVAASAVATAQSEGSTAAGAQAAHTTARGQRDMTSHQQGLVRAARLRDFGHWAVTHGWLQFQVGGSELSCWAQSFAFVVVVFVLAPMLLFVSVLYFVHVVVNS